MPYERIRLDVEGRVARLTLARPGAGNAIDGRMAAEVREACERVRQDDDVWVVLLAADGAAFCAGTDADALADLAALDAAALTPALADLRVAEAVAAVEKPVIAALSGDALDQGLELALACDVRVASLDARLGMTQLARGLLPWDGGTQRLPRLRGTRRRHRDAAHRRDAGRRPRAGDRPGERGRRRLIASPTAPPR